MFPDTTSGSFTSQLSTLLNCQQLEDSLQDKPEQMTLLVECCHNQLYSAYKQNYPQAKKDMQEALFTLYLSRLADPLSAAASNQSHPFIISLKRQIESKWFEYEYQRINFPKECISSHSITESLLHLYETHRASHHTLFDYLEHEANEEQIDYFFRSDTSLNMLFFDILAFMLPGSLPVTRTEICHNLWDEAGKGESHRTHTGLYYYLLKKRGIDIPKDRFTHLYNWQGFTGANVFMVGAINREHYYKLTGIMAITELLDPLLYTKLVNGARRLDIDQKHLRYYTEHIAVDVAHADGWLYNVIEPIVESFPNAKQDILTGAALRLQSCADYYDDVLLTLKN